MKKTSKELKIHKTIFGLCVLAGLAFIITTATGLYCQNEFITKIGLTGTAISGTGLGYGVAYYIAKKKNEKDD